MKKLFVCSDIHGFYDELMKALNKASFDINNPDHILVVCGDIFDRGEKPLEVYKFLRELPRERRILIRGNHEYLLRDLVKRGYPEDHDRHNKTIDTLYQLQGWESSNEFVHEMYREQALNTIQFGTPAYEQHRQKWEELRLGVYKGIVTDVLDWINSDEWRNYFELDNYIFVHGFIPLTEHINWEKSQWCGFIVKEGDDTFREDWRNATSTEWEDATWFNWRKNFPLVKKKLNQTGKFIVVGHWHTSDLYNFLTRQRKDITHNPVFISKRYKIVGLDACTALTHKVNVWTLEISDEEWEKWK